MTNDIYMCVYMESSEFSGRIGGFNGAYFHTDLEKVSASLKNGARVFKLNALQEIESIETTHVEKIK